MVCSILSYLSFFSSSLRSGQLCMMVRKKLALEQPSVDYMDHAIMEYTDQGAIHFLVSSSFSLLSSLATMSLSLSLHIFIFFMDGPHDISLLKLNIRSRYYLERAP